ncbi:MAG: SCO family protein [Blastomonas sp.]
MNSKSIKSSAHKAASLLAATLLLSACSQQDEPQQREAAPLEGAAIGGEFALIDQDGQPVRYSDFDGRYRMVYFGYTFCPDVCPIDLQKLMQGFALFEKQQPERAKMIQPMFITVDPDRDTPDVMKQYVAAFHPRLIGLTGTQQQVDAAAKAFVVYHKKAKAEGATDYLVDHSRQAYLMDKQGKPLGLLSFDGTPQQIAEELDRWAR